MTKASPFTYARMIAESAALRLLGKRAAQEHLLERLREIPGIPTKIAQTWVTKTGSSVDVPQKAWLSIEDSREIIRKWVPQLEAKLLDIESECKVASLSQVYRARFRDGSQVAIKIQIPGVAKELESQVETLFGAFEKLGPGRAFGEGSKELREYLSRNFRDELDYLKEAESQEWFRKQLGSYSERIAIPQVFRQMSCGTVLTQQWIGSTRLSQLEQMDFEQREVLCRALVDFYLDSIFSKRKVHGDLHSENLGFNASLGKLVIYDFGSVFSLGKEETEALRGLIEAPGQCGSEECIRYFSMMGFDLEKLEGLRDLLPPLVRILVEPFWQSDSWDPEKWNVNQRVASLLGGKKWWFRSAGPPWFFSLMRSAQGFMRAIVDLNGKTNLAEPYRKLKLPLLPTRTEALSDVEIIADASDVLLSHSLKVEVTEQAQQIVYLEFPARSAAWLETLIPVEVQMKIDNASAVLKAASQRAVSSKFSPQILFSAQVSARSYKVWLE